MDNRTATGSSKETKSPTIEDAMQYILEIIVMNGAGDAINNYASAYATLYSIQQDKERE